MRRFIVVVAIWPLMAHASALAAGSTIPCKASPKVAGQCFVMTGYLSAGFKPPRIFLAWKGDGDFAVLNGNGANVDSLPLAVREAVGPDPNAQAFSGVYELCPLEHLEPKKMTAVCMEKAISMQGRLVSNIEIRIVH